MQGDYGVALFDVPLRDDSDRHDVKEEDVRQWVLFAILEEDHKGRRLTAKITQIEVRRPPTHMHLPTPSLHVAEEGYVRAKPSSSR